MKALVTADLHLTARAQDDYRWEIFPWLKKQAANRGCDCVIIAGDLTDAKDNHPAVLVNRLIDELVELSAVCPVYGITGNHDYIDPAVPFFKFLATTSHPIHLYTTPTEVNVKGEDLLFLPHTRSWRRDWKDLKFKNYDYIFLHQAIKGAETASGFKLDDGVPSVLFGEDRTDALVIAGDIHVPQWVGNVVYCGAPYPVVFGDEYQPRVLYIDEGKLKSIKRSTIRKAKLTIDSLDDLKKEELFEGDRLMVVYQLPREDFPDWPARRQEVIDWCSAQKVVLAGLELKKKESTQRIKIIDRQPTPAESKVSDFERYCRAVQVPEKYIKPGKHLIETKGEFGAALGGTGHVQLNHLAIQGFRSFKNDQVVDFGKAGLIYLTGENKQFPELGRNACGKTTICSALSWVLTGKTDRGVRGNSVVNWDGNHLCSVGLSLTIGGTDYFITRTQDPNTLTLSVNGDEPKALSQEALEAVTGIDFDYVGRVLVMGQFNRYFLDLTPSEKLTGISDVLNLQAWTRLVDTIRRDLKSAEKERGELESSVIKVESRIETLREQVRDLEADSKRFEDEKESKLKSLRKDLEVAEKVFEEADSKHTALQATAKELNALKGKAEAALLDVDTQHREHDKVLFRAQQALKAAERDLERWGKEADKLSESKLCPTCGGKLDEKKRKSLFKEAQDKALEAAEAVKAAKAAVEDATKVAEVSSTALKAASKELDRIEDEERVVSKKLSEARNAFNAADQNCKVILSSIKYLETGENPHARRIKEVKEALEIEEGRLKTLQEGLAQASEDVDVLKYWSEQFKHLRLWLIEEAVQELEIEVNNVLPRIGLGSWRVAFVTERENTSGGITKGFTTLIYPPGNVDPVPWESYSGGETQRLRIAGAVGLAALVCSRRGTTVSVEVWDEPTAHLSEEGVEDLLMFFKDRARETGKEVWLVDHRSYNFGGFDDVVTVVKTEESGSKIHRRV